MELPSMAYALIPGAFIWVGLLAIGILETRRFDKHEGLRGVPERD